MEENTKRKKIPLWGKLLIILFIVVIGVFLYARYIATSGLIVKEYFIVNPNLPEHFNSLKIVHISDTHYGQTVNKKELENIVKMANEYKPDIIVITGDLLDQHIDYTEEDINTIASTLKKLEATMGKYIIMGNHDNTQDVYKDIVVASGLTDLDDTFQVLYNKNFVPILIAGMSTGENWGKTPAEKVDGAITYSNENQIPFNILIMHEPDYIEDFSYETFQLILAGHSHNGQIRLPLFGPMTLPSHAKKYYDNYYDLGETDLYVSSGVGTSNMKLRLFNKPSINVYRIANE